jgi:transmembrane sensor
MNTHILEQAIGWTVRLREGSAEEWRAFTDWLEADPDHLAAYDEVQRTDAALGQIAPRPRPVIAGQPPAHLPVRSRRGWLVGGGSRLPPPMRLRRSPARRAACSLPMAAAST